MLKFEWNALRADDKVLVHESGRSDLMLVPGIVVLVDSRRRPNGVGIAVTASDGERKVLWPSSLVVHHDPRGDHDANQPCWRCDALDAATAVPAGGLQSVSAEAP